MVNVEFLNKKKKQYIKNFTTFFIAIKLANFYQFSSKSTTNIIFFFYLPLSLSIYLEVSTSRSGSGLCPTRNLPNDIGFPARKPAADRKHQRVRSNRSCLISGRIGWSREWCCRRFHFDGDFYFSPDLRRICAKITRSKQKNIKPSPVFCKTHEI